MSIQLHAESHAKECIDRLKKEGHLGVKGEAINKPKILDEYHQEMWRYSQAIEYHDFFADCFIRWLEDSDWLVFGSEDD